MVTSQSEFNSSGPVFHNDKERKKKTVVRARTRTSRVKWMTGEGREAALYSIFSCSFFWKQTGRMETTARTASTAKEFQDTASPAVVSLYSVVPAFIATKDGGATPERERKIKASKMQLIFTSRIEYDCVLSHCLSCYFQTSTGVDLLLVVI